MLFRRGFTRKQNATQDESAFSGLSNRVDGTACDGSYNKVLAEVSNNEKSIIEAMGLNKNKIIQKCDRGQYAKIRIYNIWREFLHLRGIELYLNGEKLDHEALPPYSCQVGNEYNDEDKCSSYQLGVIDSKYAFHTTREEENCWFELAFESPVEFDEIRLYLRKKHEYRAISITVDLTLADGSVVTVYSGLSRFLQVSNERMGNGWKNSGFSESQFSHLYRLFWLAKDDPYKYPNPVWLAMLEESENHGLDKDEIQAFINDNILVKKELAFTCYGVRHCFKFWSEQELHDYLAATREAIDVLYDFCDSIFYAYGTLLGFVRERSNFVPHDIDIDIVCVFPSSRYHSLAEINQELKPFLESRKFKIVTNSQYSYHVKYKGSPRFDIFPALADARGNITIYPAFKGKYLNTSYLLPTIDMNVDGISCPIPKNPFKFFETVYGNDWKIPIDKNFHVNPESE